MISALKRALAWLAIGLTAAAGIFYAGARQARQKAATEAIRDNVETRERIDDAPKFSDPDIAREWLRQRGQP